MYQYPSLSLVYEMALRSDEELPGLLPVHAGD